MLGVDFVINALFETSGFRVAGDCADAFAHPTRSERYTSPKEWTGFIAQS
jgi:hypothetical protein